MDLNARIAQFENMAQADPSNEMAHFSLASAYVQAGRTEDAARAFLRCASAAPEMSKAFQLAAENFIKAGNKREAVAALQQGYKVAALRGDLMPKRAMARMFEELGEPLPEVAGAPSDEAVASAAAGSFMCTKTGRPGTQLAKPPFKGPVGKWIHENISEQTWQEWIRQGTKVINELRLDLSKDADADTYDRYMREYLGIDEGVLASLSR